MARGFRAKAICLDLAAGNNIVEKSGSWYSFAGERIGRVETTPRYS